MSTDARRDRRTNKELRPLKIFHDGLTRVDGSARFGFGDTAALASISGPIEVRLASEQHSKATFEVLVRPLSNVPATEAKSLAAIIRSSLEPSLILTKNPRTLVQLVIQSLGTPKNSTWKHDLSSAMINASSLSLLKASSIPMQGVVSAVAVGRLSNGDLVLDPRDEEVNSMKGGGAFAFIFADAVGLGGTNSDCVWTSWKSTASGCDENELLEARELARFGAQAVYDAMRKSFEMEMEVADGQFKEDKMEI